MRERLPNRRASELVCFLTQSGHGRLRIAATQNDDRPLFPRS